MDIGPRVVLLSRLSVRGETLYRALRDVCAVKWIARKSEFRYDPIRLPLLLFREFLRVLAPCRSAPPGKRPIVIVDSVGLDVIPAIAVRRITGSRVILYAVGPDVLGGRKVAQTSFLRWAVTNVDMVLCGNSRIEQEVRNLGGVTTRVLPTPFVPFEARTDGKKEFDVITVGSLTDAAKQSLLVKASAYLDPTVKIAVVGEGPQRQYLTTLSRRHGQNRVSFLGALPPKRLSGMLLTSKLYVQCASDDDLPSSVLEAACCGLPIMTLDDSHQSELTELYGLRPIVPKHRTAVSLATAIEEAMMNYSALLADVSKNKEALESYSRSWPDMAESAIFA